MYVYLSNIFSSFFFFFLFLHGLELGFFYGLVIATLSSATLYIFREKFRLGVARADDSSRDMTHRSFLIRKIKVK